ncbi:unnamed protein product [Phytophthora lilii]|uniref:Unnamed protein product n=1 Tax=Phytophthora lilii TaxID=2077276 RepID=A0A9W6WVL6_9STRA|nr:unnamed protein product [Phytophthora lilii]
MATAANLTELELGDGAWENIQVVTGAGATWHDRGQEENSNQQVEARLQRLECQLQNELLNERSAAADDSAVFRTRIERRLDLMEEEMGHIVSAIDQKADTEAMLIQGKTLQESIQAFDEEVLALQERIHHQYQELEIQLLASVSDLKAVQEAQLRSEMESWAVKTQESACKSVQQTLDHDIKQQADILKAIDLQVKLCCEAIETQQKRTDESQVEINKQVRLSLAADREDIARQCSEAHGRIDYQFRTQEEALERIQSEQRSLHDEIVATGKKYSEQTVADIAAAIGELDRCVLDREGQELGKLHNQLTEEVKLTVANSLKALEPAKERDQRRLKQHQHLVGRKLAELDQMMQLIGRQLIQNTSQLQVVRNEQLVQTCNLDLQNEEAGYDDNDLLLQYENNPERAYLVGVNHNPDLQQDRQVYSICDFEVISAVHEDTAELRERRSQHQDLQELLDKKLRDYSTVLSSSAQKAKENEEKTAQPTQLPKE